MATILASNNSSLLSASPRESNIMSTKIKPHKAFLFQKPKHQRTPKDVELAVRLLRTIPFFASMHNEAHELTQFLTDIYNAMECESFRQGEVVFHCKEQASKFYFILEGCVDLFVPKTDVEIKEDILKAEEFARSPREKLPNEFTEALQAYKLSRKTASQLTSSSNIDRFEKETDSSPISQTQRCCSIYLDAMAPLLNYKEYCLEYAGQMICKYKKLKTLGPRTQFGELALSTNSLRSATVVAASNLCVATLSKENFKKIFELFKRDFREKMNFFANLTGTPSGVTLAKFFYGFKERQYAYGQKIFSQGENPDEAFIVKKGEVQITATKFQAQDGSPVQSPRFRPKKILSERIASLGPYSLVGEDEALKNKAYETTLTSSSNETVLYVISSEEFRKLQTDYKEIFTQILARSGSQKAYFETRKEKIFSIHKRISSFSSAICDEDNKNMTGSDAEPQNFPITQFLHKKISKISPPELQSHTSSKKPYFAFADNAEKLNLNLLIQDLRLPLSSERRKGVSEVKTKQNLGPLCSDRGVTNKSWRFPPEGDGDVVNIVSLEARFTKRKALNLHRVQPLKIPVKANLSKTKSVKLELNAAEGLSRAFSHFKASILKNS